MYTPKSYRQLKRFVGELTATSAGLHAVLLDFETMYGSYAVDHLTHTAQKHHIVISGVAPRNLIVSHARLALVSILSGFDQYFSEIEAECKELGMQWSKPDKTSPIVVLQENISDGSILGADAQSILKVIEYYRMVRNWVAHPSEKNRRKAEIEYQYAKADIDRIRNIYKFRSAPNSIESVDFHDIKLLSKLLLDGLREVSSKIRPNESLLVSSIPKNLLRRDRQRSKRVKRAAKYLESQYGLSLSEAEKLVERNYDALA